MAVGVVGAPIQRVVDVFDPAGVGSGNRDQRLAPVRLFAAVQTEFVLGAAARLAASDSLVIDSLESNPEAKTLAMKENPSDWQSVVVVDPGIPGARLQVLRVAFDTFELMTKRLEAKGAIDAKYPKRLEQLWRLQVASPAMPASLAGPESWLMFRAEQAWASAFDVALNGGADVVEGALRLGRGVFAGTRQMTAGLIELAAGLSAAPLAGLETGASLLTNVLERWAQRSEGPVRAVAWFVFGLLTVLMMPLRLVTKLASTLVIRPLALGLQAIAGWVAGPDAHRANVGMLPQGLADPNRHLRFWEMERGNELNLALCDPNEWIDYYCQQADSSYRIMPPLLSELTELRRSDPLAYDRLRADLARCQIRCFYRFPSLGLLREVIANRNFDPSDTRPVALLAASVSDWNGSFSSLRSTLSELSKTHRLQYFEPANTDELARAIEQSSKQRAISSLVLAGHGYVSGMHIGDSDYGGGEDVDLGGGFSIGQLAGLKSALAPNANVLLEACETGNEESSEENLAHRLAQVWPHVNVYAPKTSDRNAGITAAPERGMFQSQALRSGELTAYRAKPEALRPQPANR